MDETIHDLLAAHDHEELRAVHDAAAGLRGFVAIHDTTLGPAAGGTRRYAFASERAAAEDALRLSRAMTYKYALAGVNMGGGKAVLWVDEDDEPREDLYRAYGRAVEDYGGRFVTGGDVGTGERELRWVAMETENVVGLPEQFDHPPDYHGGGRGVLRAMEACADLTYGDRDVGELHVAVQGVGEMGASLVRYLVDRGAEVTVADPDEAAVERVVARHGVETVAPGDVYDVDCDVFAPCALGGAIDDDTVDRLRCDVVCGAANNQLAEPRHDRALHERDVLYAPDYLANAGRTIDDTDLLRPGGYTHDRAAAMVDGIYDTMRRVGRRAAAADRPTGEVADEMAEERIERVAAMRGRRESRTPAW
ncbi:MAG: Leu/Phe/Val dehydrogenase [Halobacteriaceae archaeon]